MPSNRGAIAPTVTLCQHLTETGLEQPFALIADPTADHFQYACSHCLADGVERRVIVQNESPASVAKSVLFNRCEHQSGTSVCSTCVQAVVDELEQRWNQLLVTDRPASNRLRRVAKRWQELHSPTKQSRAERQQPKTEEQRAADKIAKQRAAIMRQRGFPEIWALQTRQWQGVVVVPPMQ